MASVRLFVYGSLKRGGRHHKELNSKRARFLGEAETCPGYRLERLGEYLALVETGEQERKAESGGATEEAENETKTETESATQTKTQTATVKGELFELDESDLPALDAFEGEAYLRGDVKLLPGDLVEKSGLALAYFKKAR